MNTAIAIIARRLHEKLVPYDDTMALIEIENAMTEVAGATMAISLQVLTEALTADRSAITNLMAHRTPCNEALTAHPTIQTTRADVGPLGLINGILESITSRRIMAVYDDELYGGVQIARFELFPAEWQNVERTRNVESTKEQS